MPQNNIDLLVEVNYRIGQPAKEAWGTQHCHDYLTSLLIQDRSEGRMGFPPKMAQLIHAALDQHNAAFPSFAGLDEPEFNARAATLAQPVKNPITIIDVAKWVCYIGLTAILIRAALRFFF